MVLSLLSYIIYPSEKKVNTYSEFFGNNIVKLSDDKKTLIFRNILTKSCLCDIMLKVVSCDGKKSMKRNTEKNKKVIKIICNFYAKERTK